MFSDITTQALITGALNTVYAVLIAIMLIGCFVGILFVWQVLVEVRRDRIAASIKQAEQFRELRQREAMNLAFDRILVMETQHTLGRDQDDLIFRTVEEAQRDFQSHA